jgi:hypothetical protein
MQVESFLIVNSELAVPQLSAPLVPLRSHDDEC